MSSLRRCAPANPINRIAASRRAATAAGHCGYPACSTVRIAFKSAIGDNPSRGWRLTVLDLATMRRTPLAETRSVDDQAAWRGNTEIMYAVRRGTRAADVWSVPADGTGSPTRLIPDAESPAALS